jgi:hypothetical protein
MTNNKILVDALDFNEIKSNIKNFLSGQRQFKDYNFEGSNLSMLIDVLAYNTYYNSIYNNLAINEVFIDSASKRNSVVSIAKQLGYIPRSTRAAKALVQVSIRLSDENTRSEFVLPRFTQFTGVVNDTTYYFITRDERVAQRNEDGVFIFDNVEIFEGTGVTEKFIVESNTRIVLNNKFCDTTTLRVHVNDSSMTGDPVIYTIADNIVAVGPQTTVFFLKERDGGLFEITFGDDVIGKRPPIGSLVTVDYIISSGGGANNCRNFNPIAFTANAGISMNVKTLSHSAGGADAETIESIRFNALRTNVTQNRAVNGSDFESIITQNFDNALSVSVWGGEDNEPKAYGKVFICVRPKRADFLTDNEKQLLINSVLKPKSIITVYPQIVDPEYLRIEVNTTFYYNPNATTRNERSIIDLVKQTIINYNSTDLRRFNGTLRHSKLSRLIDMTEKSITHNVTTITLHKSIEPQYTSIAQYTVNLGNPIYSSGVAEQSFVSTKFYRIQSNDRLYYLRDDGVGNVLLCYIDGFQEVIEHNSIGTINYASGKVKINALDMIAIDGNDFKFIFKPQSYDVIGIRNQIIEIDPTLITVKCLVDTISANNSTLSYVHTSSRS